MVPSIGLNGEILYILCFWSFLEFKTKSKQLCWTYFGKKSYGIHFITQLSDVLFLFANNFLRSRVSIESSAKNRM